jgi:transcriptional regulator with XRE-family HTH domain
MPPKEIRKPSGQLTAVLADNLRDFRHARNISQEKLAELCGLHRTYIGSVERCERNVTLSTLEVFAAVLKTTVPDLLTSKEKSQREHATQKRGDS